MEEEELLSRIWKDAAEAAREVDRDSHEQLPTTDDYGDEYVVIKNTTEEDEEEEDVGFSFAEEDAERKRMALEIEDAKWSLCHSAITISTLRYPKTSTGTCIGSRFTPYNRMSRLQKTHMRINRDNRESYLKIVENNLRRRVVSYPGISDAEIESVVTILHLVWKVSHRSHQHDKLSSFALYYGLKRFHNPTVSDVALAIGVTKKRAQSGIKEMRRLVAGESSFDFLDDLEMGTSNLYRRSLPPPVQHDVKRAAEEAAIDLRDDKALDAVIKKVRLESRRRNTQARNQKSKGHTYHNH